MAPRKRTGAGRSLAAKTLRVAGRTVTVRESARGVAVRIDGQAIPGVTRLADGEYHTEFLPFRGFASAEELVRALVTQADSTFALRSGVAAPGGRRQRGAHGRS